MTLQQLRYVVDVGRTGSISQSAANLSTSQPNLSGVIAQMEEELAIQLFHRTNRGVALTNDGVEFFSYAQKIVTGADYVEQLYSKKKHSSVSIRIAWTLDTLVSEVLGSYISRLPGGAPVHVEMMETSQGKAINAVSTYRVDIGKITIPDIHLELYERYCKSQGLVLQPLWKIETGLLFSAQGRLASESLIAPSMLTDDLIEIFYGPEELYELPVTALEKYRRGRRPGRAVTIHDRGTVIDLLTSCHRLFTRAIPPPPAALKRYNLAIRRFTGPGPTLIEAVIYPEQHFPQDAKWFLTALEEMRDPQHPRWPKGFGPEPL